MKNTTVKSIHFNTKSMILISLMTSITCIIAPFSISIPISPVPISFTNLILYISIFILGWKFATASLCIYLLLGVVGLPVFSGFTGGPAKLVGPTGGYLIGFLFLTIISGYIIEKSGGNRILELISLVIGTSICYLFGTLWLSLLMNLTFMQGLATGVLPYLFGDALKIIAAVIIGPILRIHLRKFQ